MSSLLVFAKTDNLHPDPREQWSRYAPGDVIDIAADDAFDWGAEVARLGWWRVLIVPATPAELAHLVDEEVPTAPTLRGVRRLRMRRLRLEVLSDSPTVAEVHAATVEVPPVDDYYTVG